MPCCVTVLQERGASARTSSGDCLRQPCISEICPQCLAHRGIFNHKIVVDIDMQSTADLAAATRLFRYRKAEFVAASEQRSLHPVMTILVSKVHSLCSTLSFTVFGLLQPSIFHVNMIIFHLFPRCTILPISRIPLISTNLVSLRGPPQFDFLLFHHIKGLSIWTNLIKF
jgi:hypothetical protein